MSGDWTAPLTVLYVLYVHKMGGFSRFQEIPLLGILLMTVCSALLTLNAAIVKELGGDASVLEILGVRFGVQLVFNLAILACWAACIAAGRDTTSMPPLLRTGRNWALVVRSAFEIISLLGSYYAYRHLPLGKTCYVTG